MKLLIVMVLLSTALYGRKPLAEGPKEAYRVYNLVEGLPDIRLTPLSEKIGHTWVEGKVWDKQLINKFYQVLSQADEQFVMIDLGAQTGSFSLLAKYFPKSTWYSFEPLHEAADALKRNLFLNEISNVSVYQMAASNRAEVRKLHMPQMSDWGLSTMGETVLRFSPVIEREVKCIDLDSFVADRNIPKVHFMKLDTEGWEFYILQGAKALIERDHPIILMEFNPINMKQCGVVPQEVEQFLSNSGYQWNLISSEDVLCIPCENEGS